MSKPINTIYDHFDQRFLQEYQRIVSPTVAGENMVIAKHFPTNTWVWPYIKSLGICGDNKYEILYMYLNKFRWKQVRQSNNSCCFIPSDNKRGELGKLWSSGNFQRWYYLDEQVLDDHVFNFVNLVWHHTIFIKPILGENDIFVEDYCWQNHRWCKCV